MSTNSTRFLGIDWRIGERHRNDTYVIFAYWLIAAPIMLTSFDDQLSAGGIAIAFCWMVIAYTAASWIIMNVIFPTFYPERRLVVSSIFLGLLLLFVALCTALINMYMFGDSGDLLTSVFKYQLPNESQNILTLVAVIAGRKFFEEKQRTTELESERRQSELQRLRSQVDPHFLFNSLNILDILIDDDPTTAKAFVHRLSNLYRYLIRHRDEDLVPAVDEMQHARDYNFLVEQRFGGAFHFRENFELDKLEKAYIPPGSLQTVLENVYKHNLAMERNPVTITIECKDDALYVINDFSPKPGELATHEKSGSGTANLLRRYALLTDEETYSRQQGAHWMARLPLLYLEKASSGFRPRVGPEAVPRLSS